MLVLTVSEGQTIEIGSDIVIHFVKHGRHRSKVGITAPQAVPIFHDREKTPRPTQKRKKRVPAVVQ